jgi:hypothetical protein
MISQVKKAQETRECIVMSPYKNTVLFKAKLIHHFTESSANTSVLRLSFHQVSGDPVFLNEVFRLFS